MGHPVSARVRETIVDLPNEAPGSISLDNCTAFQNVTKRGYLKGGFIPYMFCCVCVMMAQPVECVHPDNINY